MLRGDFKRRVVNTKRIINKDKQFMKNDEKQQKRRYAVLADYADLESYWTLCDFRHYFY